MNAKGEATLKICKQKLKYFNYSEHTVRIYTWYINQFLQAQNKSAQHLNATDFSNYMLNYKFTSNSQQNQVINAIKFLYEKVLNKKYNKVDFDRPRTEKHLPRAIDQYKLLSKLNNIPNIKHKAILTLAFSVGLRVSEVINLKITDIDSRRMLIFIHNAKGKKDRIVPLTPTVLEILRNYYRIHRPKMHLFEGPNNEKYSASSCNNIFKKYIDANGHFHLLRHSGLTAMLENGTDLRVIQKIAGHNSSRTTEVYTHVSTRILQAAKTAV